MAIGDIAVKADAEFQERHRMNERRAVPIRLDQELWSRLDRLALELGWSRNKVVAELLEEGSTDLSAILARDESGNIDPRRFEYLLGDV